MNKYAQRFVSLGHHPDDSKDEKLKKSSLLVVSGPFAFAGIIWGILYFARGLTIPGSIPFIYGLLSVASIINFSYTKRYRFFRNSQLTLILILPFALQISLGGFVASSAVIYWAIIAPAGAMFFDSVKRSVHWFGAYITLVIIAFLINGFLPEYVNWDLSGDFVNALFLMNILGVSGIVFGILYYFVSTITKLNNDIEAKNEALREQSEQLKEMDKIKSRFFANISHEFRTPLTLILGLMNKQKTNIHQPPDQKDNETMRRNAHRLLQLINQLLDLSKIESGGLKLQAAKDDFELFVKNVVSQFESMAEAKKLKLTFNGHPIDDENTSAPLEFYFDHEKINKVLNNLLSNAVKFTPENEHVAIEVEKDAAGGSVSVKVMNTGVEIPEEKLNHVFNRFFQVDASSNRKFEGTGIGLALVKELVEAHHGSVQVESKMNKTTFSFHLPLDSDYLDENEKVELSSVQQQVVFETENQPGKTIELPFGDTDENRNLHILITEDNSDLRSFIKNILKQEYQITEAADGIEGFAKAEELIPDLIVSDVMMPRMDGYDFCRQIKTNEKTNHIPVILLTAKATRENKLEGLETGADDYLVKPFDEEELKVRIRNLIATREQLQRKFQSELRLRPNEVKVTSVHQEFIEKLKGIVEKNIDNETFGVEELGVEMGMSRSQVHRKLKAITNQSASTFIRNYRLHRAADLLKQAAGNVTEIAYRVGFNSQTYFSSSFKELFDCSPGEYKQKFVNENS